MNRRKNNPLNSEFLIFEQHFKELIRYLKQTKKRQLPTYIVLGNDHSGKSTLLSSSELEYTKVIPARQAYTQAITQTTTKPQVTTKFTEQKNNYCRWWIDKQKIFLDIPSHILQQNDISQTYSLWKFILEKLRKNKRWLNIQGIIFVISVEKIDGLDTEQLDQRLELNKQRILEIHQQLKCTLPLYLILSKCDLIKGFKEYFSNLRQDELQQCLGIRFDLAADKKNKYSTDHTITDEFNKKYDNLITQLHSHVITRLHQERNLTKRAFIKNFPNQLEYLQTSLSSLIAQFIEHSYYCKAIIPIGLYLTSASQSGNSIDYILPGINHQLGITESSPEYLTAQHPYFLKHFFQQEINSFQTKSGKTVATKSKRKFEVLYTAFSLIILGVIGFFLSSYFDINHIIKRSDHELTQLNKMLTQQTTANQLSTIVKEINLLGEVNNNMILLNSATLMRLNATSFNKFKHQPYSIYQNILSKILLPKFLAEAEHPLKNLQANPIELYKSLKIYLMIINPKHRDSAALQQWFYKQFGKEKRAKELFYFFIAAINSANTTTMLNHELIQQVRNKLNSLSKYQLIYLEILNQTNQKSYAQVSNLLHDNNIFKIANSKIPAIYTASGFKNIFLPNLNNILQSNTLDNWVLGKPASQISNKQQLLKSVLTIYFKHYSNYWESYYNGIKLIPVFNLNQIHAVLNELNNNNSKLRQTLQEINLNTSKQIILTNLNTNTLAKSIIDNVVNNVFNNRFASVNKLLRTLDAKNPLNPKLNALNKLIANIVNADNSNEAAFNTAIHIIKNQQNPIASLITNKQNLVKPLNHWIPYLANSTWQIILKSSSQYINQAWNQSVVPFYKTNIAEYYPFNTKAFKSVTINNFNKFFATKGILNAFFQTYLKAFIDTDAVRWHLKTVYQEKLAINKNIPELFERAFIIRKMFFANNQNDANIKFTLQQIAFEPLVKSIHLNLNGQEMYDQRGSRTIYSFAWPGNNNNNKVSLTMQEFNGQNLATSYSGQWALFKLLAHSNIKTTKSPMVYIVSFDIDGVEVRYKLAANRAINPFIPNIINRFKLPMVL